MSDSVSVVTVAPPWLWVSFTVSVVVLLFIDLSLFRKAGTGSTRRVALFEAAAWISIALAFNLWFGIEYGKELGIEFLTGYLVEESLSVDNLFVMLLIFSSFRIPHQYQHKVLFWGILGAIVFRAFFIVVGAKLLSMFHWILYIFGAILVLTAIKFLKESDEKIDVKENWAIRVVKRFIPTTAHIHGHQFFIREHGILKATPLFLALVVVEVTDIVFAVDSIPAVFAVTQDAFVAFGSNILAILGLRSLYFVLADLVGKLRYLKPGLAVILGFIGIKMLIVDFVKIPSWISLLVIFAVLTTAGLSSWYVARVSALKGGRTD